MTVKEQKPQHILLKAGEGSPLHLGDAHGGFDQAVEVMPDAPALALSHRLTLDLWEWSSRRPVDVEPASQPEREHYRQGLPIAARLAAELGRGWVTGYYDASCGGDTRVCWQCGGFHWRLEPHPDLGQRRTVYVEAEYGYAPLRFDVGGQSDFKPGDPEVGLPVSHPLIEAFDAWNERVHDRVEASFNPKAKPKRPPVRSLDDLRAEGARLATLLANELGDGWTVEHIPTSHG